ncbi:MULTISPECIES: GAF domain-containing sensor histidine kinase [unclassified Gordonia (in: high G+C Gram-positive bacteria)]|uniref:GAF domain-containing sensor histidine kinase n=1 Tax=unclassified Gordonia (in: high G+C Gram-positive bacteria) TaxID=2657482 RepID=UPI001F0ECE49|nr:GAF domain-containing sensor histidine kinase [Gordonia sp. ABSL49_1]MCH5642408.1 histidine kinase [Gordonia sp. ABSL49_1]
MRESGLREALDAVARHGADDPTLMRDLLEAVLVVGQGLDLDDALQRIVEVAVGVVDARYGALGVRGPDGDLSAFVYTGITPKQRAQMGDLPVGRGVLGVLMDDPHILRIPDLSQHPASVGFPPHHPPMTTFLGAPIIIRGAIFGRIYLTEKRSASEFTELDETLIAVLAVAAGIAVDNSRLFERARTRHRWMQLVARRGSEPLAGIALSDTMSRLCTDVADLVGAIDVFIVTDDAGEVEIRGHTGAAIEPDAFASPSATSLKVQRSGEIAPALVRRGAQWTTVQPLQRAAGAFGWILITHHDRPHWEPEEIAGLAGVAEVASLAVVYAEQQQVARDLEVLEDRHRIARDLHDHVIQRLFAVGMSVQTLLAHASAGTSPDPESVNNRLEQIMTDLDRTIAQIRTSIFDLQTVPGHHDTSTLRRRVLDIVSELSVHAPISPSVSFDGPVDTVVPESLGPHIDAVLREGLSNALRHAHAEHIGVSVSADDVLTVEITDDGVGIGTDVTYRGLDNLTRRAEECDGTFTVVTTPRHGKHSGGTTLTWSVPLVG